LGRCVPQQVVGFAMFGRVATLVGAAGLIAIASGVALADDPAVIETVIVLAQKRESALQDVPMSVTALTAAQLDAAGLDDIAEISHRLPTFDQQRTASATTTTFRIRRIGNLGNIPTFEPAVGLFVDGAFRSRSMLGTNELLDVERIEVLSGPQSTLYGKNVSAGLVAIYTRTPAKQFEGRLEATGGWLDTPDAATLRRFKLSISGPLGADWSAGIALARSRHDHTLSNELAGGRDGDDEDCLAARGQLQWTPSEGLDLRLLAGYAQEQDDQGAADVYLAPGTVSSTVADILLDTGAATECGDNVPSNRRFCLVAPNTLDLQAVDLTLLGRYRLANGWTLDSITAWDRYEALRSEDDAAQLSAPILFFRDSEEGSSLQQELRLSSEPNVALSWLAGISYYRNDYERGKGGKRPMFGAAGNAAFHPIWPALLDGLPLALPDQLGIHDSTVETRYLGVFGTVSWRLTERLSLITGLRWQDEKKNAVIDNSTSSPDASLISLVLTPARTPDGQAINGNLKRDSDGVTWSLTPQYRVNDDLIGYLTVTRGTKSGGFNTGFGNVPLSSREFGDETIVHYELGARGSLANGRARFSAAAFYTEYQDYQDAAFVSAQFTVGNVEQVDLRGVELEATILFGADFAADLAVSVADLTYGTNTTGMCFPGRAPDGTAPGSCDLSGEHPINAPVWATHLGLQYERPLSWGGLYARLDWSWTGRYNTSFSADPRLVQDPHSDVALRLGMRLGPHYELILWGKNLLDNDVTVIDGVLNLFNDASYQSYMAQPRSYGLTLRVSF
jgi:iron complex outermembrane recepter protein